MKHRWNPRKIITRVIVFLILGATVNVVVAWGAIVWSPGPDDPMVPYKETEGVKPWPTRAPDHWPNPRTVSSYSVWGITQMSASVKTNAKYEPVESGVDWRILFQVNYLAGWPCRSLQMPHNLEFTPESGGFGTNDYSFFLRIPSWMLPSDAAETRRFPYLPYWSGFAINTVFYAPILWLLWLMPFQIRRAVRIRCGRCPKCSYPAGKVMSARSVVASCRSS